MWNLYYKSKICSILIIIILVLSGFILILNINPELNSAFAASSWEQTSDKHFNNGTLDNLTIVGSGDPAVLQIDISDLHHWLQQSPGASPQARGSHTGAAIDGDDKVVIFGGSGGRDDTWEYDLTSDTWTDQTKTTKPPARTSTAMASIDGDDKTVLFGGYSSGYRNDTWEYDSSTGSWTEKYPMSSPSARYGHSLATIYGDDKALFFGGATGTGGWTYYNDTWMYDSSDGQWTQMSPATAPRGRYYSALAAFHGTKKILLFGGRIGWTSYDDVTWVYDYSTDSWVDKNPGGSKPSARGYAAMAAIPGDDKVVLFGGSRGGTYYGDTWVYDLSDNKWTEVLPRPSATEPSDRSGPIMALIDGTDKVLLFGGSTGWSQYSSETWLFRYRIPTRNGTYTSAPFDTGASSDFQSIEWYSTTPANTSIKLQIRTATNKTKLDAKSFVGPDGSAGSYYTSSPSNIWEGHYGDKWVQYIAYLNITVVDESPSLDEVTITYNCLPNTIVVSPKDGTLLTVNKPTFKWSFEDEDSFDQQAFQVEIDNNITFTSIDFDSGEQNTEQEQWEFPSGTGYSEIPDGQWYWRVRTKDADNAWTEFSESRKLRIDTQPPNSAPEYPANEGFYNNVLTITGIAHDALKGSGLDKIEIAINRLSDNNYWDGTKWVGLTSWLPANGTESWHYDSSEIKWTSGTKYRVQSCAIDKASNIEIPDLKNVFTIDQDSPESIIVTPADNIWINSLNMISGTSMDLRGSGVEKVDICIKCSKDYHSFDGGPKEGEFWSGSDWIAQQKWLKTSGTEQWSINTSNIPFTTGDHYLIQSRSIDKTDNVEIPGPGITFMYDAKPPENLQIFINNDDEYTSSTGVILSLQAEDVGSGLSQMSFSTDHTIWSKWEIYNSSRSYELSAVDGKKTIYFKVKDFTGNEATHVFDTITLDSTPPENLEITIQENSKYANSRRIKLDLKAIDRVSGVGETSFSYDGIKWTKWEAFEQVRYLDLPGNIPEGNLKVYFKVKDKVENTASPVYDSIILDTKDPYALSMVINKGALESNSTLVTLELQALDDTSGVSEISFSTDGNTWSDWEEFVNSKSYTLTQGNGQKTISYRVRDHAGNIAEPIAQNIKLNITSPQEKEPSAKASGDGLEFWLILIIVIVVILVLVIMALLMIIRRKRRAEQELAAAGAVTIRPGGLAGPMIGVGAQFGTGAAGTQFPQLAKSTQTAQPTVQARPSPTVIPQQLPALPPARIPTTTTPTPTVGPSTPSPTIAQPKQTPTVSTTQPQKLSPTTPTPTIAAPGPSVHLPGTTSKTPTPTIQPSITTLEQQVKKPTDEK